MRFNGIIAGLLAAASASSTVSAEPLISESASSGTMVVNGNEAFYDPSEAEAFDAADPLQSNSNGWEQQQSVSYTAEGTVTTEVIDGVMYETVTDPSGRIIQGSRAVQTY